MRASLALTIAAGLLTATSASAETYICKPSEAYRLSESMKKVPVDKSMEITFDTDSLVGQIGGKSRKFVFTGERRNTGLGLRLQAGEVAISYSDRLPTGSTKYRYTATWTSPFILLATKGSCVKGG